MSQLEWIDRFISERKAFAVCTFPYKSEHHIFDEWNGNTLFNHAGDTFIIQPESEGDFSKPQATTTKQEHHEMVESAISAIKSGNPQKVIISTIKSVERNGQLLSAVFEKLFITYPTAFRYLCYHPQFGTWAGASPELLLKKEGNQYNTTALAGTVKTNASETPVWNEKLIHEQALVTDGIKNDLNTIGIYNLIVSEPKAHQAGPVTHLKTDFRFESTTGSSDKIIAALHPTAAVCGFPREDAKSLYNSLEKHQRRLYTGYLGVKKSNDDSCYFVNLRCMQVFDDHFELHVGGGITAGSIAADEWEETEQKAKVLKVISL